MIGKIRFKLSILSLLILLIIPVSAATREEGVIDFIDKTRVSESGFANVINGELKLESTVNAMHVKSILANPINNSLDILYYFQRLQNESGGFSPFETSSPTLDATITAVYGFRFLDINQSQFTQWQIFPFLNQTSQNILLSMSNGTTSLSDLTPSLLLLWHDYISTATILGNIPNFPILDLINAVKALQYSNGSYYNFDTATNAVLLLHVLGEKPDDPDLAKKFILTFLTESGAFSSRHNGTVTLEATYQAINALSILMDLYQLETRTDISRFVFRQQKARSGFIEVDEQQVTVSSTLRAIQILQLLNELDELGSPDVLQEVGFVSFPSLGVAVIIGGILIIRRKLDE